MWGRYERIGLILLSAVLGGAACGGAGNDELAQKEAHFTVRLSDGTTAENIIPQIIAAAGEPLSAMCKRDPALSVRVMNPLDTGTYTDVPCASVLSEDSEPVRTIAAVRSDRRHRIVEIFPDVEPPAGGWNHYERDYRAWSPVGLGCTLLMTTAGLGGSFLLDRVAEEARKRPPEKRPKEEDLENAQEFLEYSMGALGVLCAFI